MTWTITQKDVGFDLANSATYHFPITGSGGVNETIDLTGGNLYVLFVEGRRTGGANPSPTISGTTSPWTFINSSSVFESNTRILHSWYYKPASTETARNLTVTWLNAQSHCFETLLEIGGFDPGQASPVLQSTGSSGSAITIMSQSLPNPPSINNLVLAAFQTALTSTDISPDATFTEVSNISGTGGASDSGWQETQYNTTLKQNVSASVATNSDWGAVVMELIGLAAVGGSVFLALAPTPGAGPFIGLSPIPGGTAPISLQTF